VAIANLVQNQVVQKTDPKKPFRNNNNKYKPRNLLILNPNYKPTLIMIKALVRMKSGVLCVEELITQLEVAIIARLSQIVLMFSNKLT
jgi:hypothetical protein